MTQSETTTFARLAVRAAVLLLYLAFLLVILLDLLALAVAVLIAVAHKPLMVALIAPGIAAYLYAYRVLTRDGFRSRRFWIALTAAVVLQVAAVVTAEALWD